MFALVAAGMVFGALKMDTSVKFGQGITTSKNAHYRQAKTNHLKPGGYLFTGLI